MPPRRTLRSRLRTAGYAGAVAVLGGCTQIFGFQSPATFCHLNSDCPDNDVCSLGACTRQCNATKDCAADEVCSSDGFCRQASDAAVAEEASPDTGASADGTTRDDGPASEAAVACTDATMDAGGTLSCPDGRCIDGRCFAIVTFGVEEATANPDATTMSISSNGGNTGGVLAGIPIDIDHPGWVVDLGVLTAEGGAEGYLGLYTDNHEVPDSGPASLVVETNELTMNGDVTSSAHPTLTVGPVTPTYVTPGKYWILGIWQSEVALEITTGDLTCPIKTDCDSWYFDPAPFGPLPMGISPTQSQPTEPIPILYADVAE
jgi:hypothetical protein